MNYIRNFNELGMKDIQLAGGEYFAPKEENPMIGFRGASRNYSHKYRDMDESEKKIENEKWYF